MPDSTKTKTLGDSKTSRLLVVLTFVIVVADWMQPIVLPWRPKFYGAIAGGFLYLIIGSLALLGSRRAHWLGACFPIVPIAALVSTALELPFPARADWLTASILVPQLLFAAVCLYRLRRRHRP